MRGHEDINLEVLHIADPFGQNVPGTNGARAVGPPCVAESPRTELVDLRLELADDAAQLRDLQRPLPARVVELTCGKTDLDLIDLAGDWLGLMVLHGLLLVELEAGRAHIGWLVGDRDLVRPLGMLELALTEHSRWRAVSRATVAVLDRDFAARALGVPLVSRVLINRATRTSNWLLAKALIASSPRIEDRLLLMFGLFGERWGRVTPQGVALKLPLTHANLAVLCGARRPSVTVALHSLERAGLLSCTERGTWLLRRSRVDNGNRPSSFSDYERSLGISWSSPEEADPLDGQLSSSGQSLGRNIGPSRASRSS